MLSPFPDVVTFRAWKTHLVHAVVQASARSDQTAVISWVSKVFEKGVTLDDLQSTPKSFVSLDNKLATASL